MIFRPLHHISHNTTTRFERHCLEMWRDVNTVADSAVGSEEDAEDSSDKHPAHGASHTSPSESRSPRQHHVSPICWNKPRALKDCMFVCLLLWRTCRCFMSATPQMQCRNTALESRNLRPQAHTVRAASSWFRWMILALSIRPRVW